jgi:hypothetical protein
MKINYAANSATFCNLKNGCAFTFFDGDLYMKVESQEGCPFNAVSLQDGQVFAIDSDALVYPVPCEIQLAKGTC